MVRTETELACLFLINPWIPADSHTVQCCCQFKFRFQVLTVSFHKELTYAMKSVLYWFIYININQAASHRAPITRSSRYSSFYLCNPWSSPFSTPFKWCHLSQRHGQDTLRPNGIYDPNYFWGRSSVAVPQHTFNSEHWGMAAVSNWFCCTFCVSDPT